MFSQIGGICRQKDPVVSFPLTVGTSGVLPCTSTLLLDPVISNQCIRTSV